MGTVGLKSIPVSLLFLDFAVVQFSVVMSGFPRRCAVKVSSVSSGSAALSWLLYLL